MSYCFADKDDLQEAALTRHPKVEGARIQVMIARQCLGTPDAMADAIVVFVIEGGTVRRQQLITEYVLMVESAQRPALQE